VKYDQYYLLEKEIKTSLASILEEDKPMSTVKLSSIVDALKTKVIGQDVAVSDVSLAIYKHIIRIDGLMTGDSIPLASSNVLLMGPTGSGKTYICKLLGEMTSIPVLEIDCTNVGIGGSWAGDGFATLIKKHAPPPFSIVFLDEIDKIISPSPNSSGKDVNKELQASLLKILEGYTVCENSHDLLFILSGSFAEFDKHHDENKASVGFLGEKEDSSSLVGVKLRKKLIEFGMIPELAGRIKKMTKINNLTKDDFMKILKSDHTDNPRAIYNRLFSEHNVKKIPLNAMEVIAQEAVEMGLGVRGLYNLIDEYIDKRLIKYDLSVTVPYLYTGGSGNVK